MSDWLSSVSRLAGELAWQARRAAGAVGRAAGDAYHVVGYRGYASASRVLVLARVLQDEGIASPKQEQSRWSNLLATLKRIESDPLPFARIRVTIGGVSQDVVADEEGFVREWIPLAEPLTPAGWHDVGLELLEAPRADRISAPVIRAPVLVPPSSARFGVVSDIDDTVIQSDVSNFLRAARIVLMENALTRLPFPGVAAFYRALAEGASGGEHNPVFYVSSSPWNIHDVIEGFLAAQKIPVGPLLLRDWDLQLRLHDHHAHKMKAIREIFDAYPSLPFVLVGDSTQEDPEIYSAIVREYPARVLAVYIRSVSPRPERVSRIQELATEVRTAGSVLVLADDTLAAARNAVEKGFIAESALPEIEGERAEDEGRGVAKEPSPGVEAERGPTVVVDPQAPAAP